LQELVKSRSGLWDTPETVKAEIGSGNKRDSIFINEMEMKKITESREQRPSLSRDLWENQTEDGKAGRGEATP
jgi:hypothetical protein